MSKTTNQTKFPTPPKMGEDWDVHGLDPVDQYSAMELDGLYWWTAFKTDATGIERGYELGCTFKGEFVRSMRIPSIDYDPAEG